MGELSAELAVLNREHFVAALGRLDAGEASPFAESTKFDVVFDGKRYAPKRVAGLALSVATGKPYVPKSFKGGDSSSCFRALRRCGFTIAPKPVQPALPFRDVFAEILTLQTKYDSKNTESMQRRGELIRSAVPELLMSRVDELEPIFSRDGYSFAVEGSDGVGRKNASAWVRIFDPLMSPSATSGWYLVLHFALTGEALFATIECGATTFRDGSLHDIPAKELVRRVEWARDIAAGVGFPAGKYQDPIDLHGNKLSKQFELATAFARRHEITSFDAVDFWQDIELLCQLLVSLYEAERVGKDPLAEQPEVLSAQAAIEQAISPTTAGSRRGQGRGLSPAERKAVEIRAMEVALATLQGAGFTEIRDTSANASYDYSGKRNGKTWLVEVKGTTSLAADIFLLTAQELALHKGKLGQSVLVLVSNIVLTRHANAPTASGGTVELLDPWNVDQWIFEPTAFRAKRA